MTADDFRQLALGLPGAIEASHMGHPDFRVGGRIFATLGYAGDGWGMVQLTPQEQALFIAIDSEMFVPAKGAWGRSGSTMVRLKAAKKGTLRKALRAAWQHKALQKPSKARRPPIAAR